MRCIASVSQVALAALVAALLPAAARAQTLENPFDAEQQRLADEVRQRGRTARAILPLIQLNGGSGNVRPEVTVSHLERLSTERRLSPAVRMYARALLARARTRAGDPDATRRELDAIGYVRQWRVIGSFDNEGKTGFARAYGPEAARMAPVDPDATYQGREREARWREYPDVTRGGYISFDAVFRPRENVCGYAEAFVESERARALTLWVGGGGATRVWWNGEVVHEDEAYRTPHIDRAVAVVGAHRGLNRVLVKTCVTDGSWGFYLRVADDRGEPTSGLRFRASAPADEVAQIATGHGVPRLPAAPMAPFAALREAAEAEGASVQAREDLARFLVATGSDDPAEERARDLAAEVADAEPTVARLTFAVALSTQRGVAMRFVDQALALDPDSNAARLLSARFTSGGPSPEAALALLDRLPRGSLEWMQGQLLYSSILQTLGFGETARTHVEQAAAFAPGASRWIAARAGAAGATMRVDELIALRREVLTARWDDLGSRRVLLDDALSRADSEAALEHLRAYERLAAARSTTYIMAAEVYEALGRSDEAFAALRRGLEVAPEEARLHIAQGQMLLRAGQADAGADALRAALALRPQDASTRELLEHLAPQERMDEAYAVDPETLLARRRESDGFPLTVLEDLSVKTMFESGLGSEFRQIAVQIHDAEGARQWNAYSIQFDPDVQRVDVRQARVFRDGELLSATRTYERPLGEPWYRIYYDTRALVVAFPDLEPGDMVELRYRVDDVAPRNLFHDYFGDLTYLQRSVPVASVDYILIAPTRRALFFNEPSMASLPHTTLEHTVTEDAEHRVYRYHAADVPALRPEPSMPGSTEVMPYLHVSTYRTWDDVGRWYWGLIQDQLHADDDLRQTVQGLVANAPDVRTKVARIYDWVIRNTRYVALEFGIHGFLPYRVPEIVDRGFGDCKDKAALIYTMLREAGIDARIVLTRTRRNGEIHDLPASLAVFDHAIAYVPELDLYLDGTAEFTGIDELPRMDQGVTVLRVGPESVELARTPVLPSSSARRSREVSLTLSADGSGRVQVAEQVVGVGAPGYRSRYQSEGLRRERLERATRSLFPGLEITEFGFENLDDFNVPVQIHYNATAPTLAVRDGPTLRVAPTVLGGLSRSLARASTRQHPLELGALSSYSETRQIHLPRGWRVGDLPEGGVAESRFGHVSVNVSRGEQNTVSAQTQFAIEVDRVSPTDYAEFRRWVEQADRLLRQRILLEPGGES